MDITAVLEQLLDEVADTDLAGLRTARLREIDKKQKRALNETLEALDDLIERLSERERKIASGEVKPPAKPKPAKPKVESARAKSEPAKAKPEPARVEAAKPKPVRTEAAKKAKAASEAPTRPLKAVKTPSDDTAEELAAVREAPSSVTRPETPAVKKAVEAAAADSKTSTRSRPKTRVPSAPDELSEAPTIAELPSVTDELLAQVAAAAEAAPAEPVKRPAADPRFHEQPTVIIGAVDDDQLAAYEASLQSAPDEQAEITPEAVAQEVHEDHDTMSERGAHVTDELNRPAAPLDIVEEEAPTPGWTRPAELLFDDALRLFRLGDSDGALISLERLLTAMDLNEDLHEFIRVNEDRLLDLYQAIIGPWEKVPQRMESPEPMPPGFFATPKISHILGRINGRASLDDLMSDQMLTRLETIAVVSQLLRAKAITTDAVH